MKKCALIILVGVITAIGVYAQADFASSLKSCSRYTDSGIVETEGMKVSSVKQILGWDGDRCVYQEKVNFSGMDITTMCKLSKPQITELTSIMNAYSLVQKYSNNNVDTSSLSAVQDNPVIKVWNKYLQDPNTCKMIGLDGLKQ